MRNHGLAGREGAAAFVEEFLAAAQEASREIGREREAAKTFVVKGFAPQNNKGGN